MTYPSRAEAIQYTSPQLEILTVPRQCQEGPDHDADDDDAGAEAELLSLKKNSSTDTEPSPDTTDKSYKPQNQNLKQPGQEHHEVLPSLPP